MELFVKGVCSIFPLCLQPVWAGNDRLFHAVPPPVSDKTCLPTKRAPKPQSQLPNECFIDPCVFRTVHGTYNDSPPLGLRRPAVFPQTMFLLNCPTSEDNANIYRRILVLTIPSDQ